MSTSLAFPSKARRILYLTTTRSLPVVAVGLATPKLPSWEMALPVTALTAWTIAEAALEHDGTNDAARTSSYDRGSRRWMVAAHLFAWWAPVLERGLFGGSFLWPRYLLGLSVLGTGATLRLHAVATLGPCFTGHVSVTEGQELCTRGLYRHIRHPSYVGLLLLNIGPALTLGAWMSLALVAMATVLTNWYRARVEEAALSRALGPIYMRYQLSTGKWLPHVTGRVIPGMPRVGRSDQ